MKIRGKLLEVLPLIGGKVRYVIEGGISEEVNELVAQDLDIELKKHKEKRSLDANAYFFVLCDKIAEKTGIPKTEVYRQSVREIGGNSDTVCVQDKAVDALIDGWQRNGLGWMAEPFPSKIEGCTNVTLYYGSSTYDTKQMSRLIDNVVQEAKQLGIETMTPQQIEWIKEAWDGKQ